MKFNLFILQHNFIIYKFKKNTIIKLLIMTDLNIQKKYIKIK